MDVLVIVGGMLELIDNVCLIINYFFGGLGKVIVESFLAVGYIVIYVIIKYVLCLI